MISIIPISANKFGQLIRAGEFNASRHLAVVTARGGVSILRYLKANIRKALENKGALIYRPDLAPSEELFNEFETIKKSNLGDKKTIHDKKIAHRDAFKTVNYEARYLTEQPNPVLEVEDHITIVFLICNCGVGFQCHNKLLRNILTVKVFRKEFDWNGPGYGSLDLCDEDKAALDEEMELKREYNRKFIASQRRK